jgi:hypothetical protein
LIFFYMNIEYPCNFNMKTYWIIIDIVNEDKDESVAVKQRQPDDIE